uniref:Photosystem I assembly protein Ycf4 n=1 Tax=Zygnema circumcarinatum TaxID=35869 RepID=A0A6N0GXD0_ZYGCR|nr:hypothetical chloroplast RF4 [Zygnema circumcarinatum]
MNTHSDSLRIDLVKGSRRISNLGWAFVLLLGTSGFLLTGLTSYFGKNLLPLFSSSTATIILFAPQGLVMCFYGIAGLFLSTYLWCTIIWNVGSGYNEFDRREGIITIFRWGFPGNNRRIRIRCLIQNVKAVRIETTSGVLSRNDVCLVLKDKQKLVFNQLGDALTLQEIEEKAVQLAQFLQVPVEGV